MPGFNPDLSMLQQYEGYSPNAYEDWSYRPGTNERYMSGYRYGWGQTAPSADATIGSEEDAIRMLEDDVNTNYLPGILRVIPEDVLNSLGSTRQGVLVDLAHNYGSIPHRLYAALQSGDHEAIARAIEGLAGDNNGINRHRRMGEAAAWRAGGGTATQSGAGIRNTGGAGFLGGRQGPPQTGGTNDGSNGGEGGISGLRSHPILERMAADQSHPYMQNFAEGVLERAGRGEGLIGIADRIRDRRDARVASGTTVMDNVMDNVVTPIRNRISTALGNDGTVEMPMVNTPKGAFIPQPIDPKLLAQKEMMAANMTAPVATPIAKGPGLMPPDATTQAYILAKQARLA